MKPVYFIYSEKQRKVIFDREPKRPTNLVYIDGKFIPYTEINDTGKSNWDDACQLGIHPSSWIVCNGVIQDGGLADFINQGDSK